MNLQTWLRLNRLPGESTEQATERYAVTYGLEPAEKQNLIDENQNRGTEELAEDNYTRIPMPGSQEPEGYIADPDTVDSFGRSVDLFQAGAGNVASGPFAGFLENTLDWEEGADWARDYGEDVTRRNLVEAAQVAPAKSREEIIAEDPTSL